MTQRSDEISGGCSKSRSAEATARRQSKEHFCECGCPSNHHGLASWNDAGCENSSCAGKCLRSYESFQPDPVAYEAKSRERKKLMLEDNWFELCKAAEHGNMQLRRENENLSASESGLREGLRELANRLGGPTMDYAPKGVQVLELQARIKVALETIGALLSQSSDVGSSTEAKS